MLVRTGKDVIVDGFLFTYTEHGTLEYVPFEWDKVEHRL